MTTSTAPTSELPAAAARPRAGGGARRFLVALILLGIIAAAGFFGYRYWLDGRLYLSSDDALVDSNLTSIASPSGGTLFIWKVQPGETVKAGQIIGTVRPAPGSTLTSIDVKAPISGTVLRVDGKENQVISAGQSLAYVADLGHLTITAFVDESALAHIHPGQDVDVTVDSSAGVVYHGQVTSILPAAASQFALIPSSDRGTGNFTKVTQRMEVHISLGDTTGLPLYPGSNATIRIHMGA